MKKSVLLAVSAMSLGLVGVAAFTPVVSAESAPASQDQTISVKVNGTLGIGGGSGAVGTPQGIDMTTDAIDANSAKESAEQTVGVTNNTGASATLTVTDKDDDTNLVSDTNDTNKIPTADDGASLTAGTSGWGFKGGLVAEYTAMPAKSGKALTVYKGSDTQKDISVKIKVSTSTTQAAGTYTDTISYTLTKD